MTDYRCLVCREVLVPDVVATDDGFTGKFTLLYNCPNAEQHGKTVMCENGCGEKVLRRRQHYSSTQGVIGSGRWSCIRRPDPEMYAAFALEPPELKPKFTLAAPLYLDPDKPHGFYASANPDSCAVCHESGRDARHARDNVSTELVRLQELERKVIGDTFHVVNFKPDQWFIIHTLECRMLGMTDCGIHAQVATDAPDFRDNAAYGRYRIDVCADGTLEYTKLGDE